MGANGNEVLCEVSELTACLAITDTRLMGLVENKFPSPQKTRGEEGTDKIRSRRVF